MQDQKRIFYILLGASSCIILILLIFNIKLYMDSRSADAAAQNYTDTALLYKNRTRSMSDLNNIIIEKKNSIIEIVNPTNEDKYLESVQEIASIFSRNDVRVLEVNPKLMTKDVATNFDIIKDDAFLSVKEFVMRVVINGEESKIVKSINSIINMPVHFYVENISIDHPDDNTRGNTFLTLTSNWRSNE